ncbi:mRNA-degrading endonuclease RelE of RelBE toxin-antitoxin system [Anoxybacillus voinovskiensis]|uniref:mRNA-degrading endonuclease RelE of RelBE toxin-antitoxin system n=1 Tax=Anoxybacteroides voinovskiense TaxID=230470 RepID=A0A840DN52_9BACL|nr:MULTISPECIES: type II toxin-antitoxin system RelE/ParE family toxin [Anoxybacillus]MBB4074504.1 mRNA-degrading endonuclease RelE of RelBE toxin-antitoxin system [Anoxybacillus voinovskiensis]MCL6586617.1 type II toxin-antitoxin system RelE/ParE family toxin [Anoxybacillus sp.]GGJ71563.1 addiction module toxin RelE [Anoxybacillus voinovskiensis]
MMNNRLTILPKAEKAIKKLTKHHKELQEKFYTAFQEILFHPLEAGKRKTGDLAGVYGYDIYHRGINYEIAYIIEYDENGNVIVVILAGTRENFYDERKRYMRTSKTKPRK